MTHNPKITVIIPTRERGEVLKAALRTVCAQDYDGLDILVSDNCSTDCTQEVVRAANDPRVRYINTGQRLSMSHNWEFALAHVPVDDRYVMIIGDDDGIIPGALNDLAELIRETRAKAIQPSFVTFIWPNEGNQFMGRLLVPMRRGHQVRDSRTWLKRVITGRNYYSQLPMLYGGGVHHISLIDNIRRINGRFFNSNQPDVFSTIALSSVSQSYVYSRVPFAIAGHSRHSNGASSTALAKGNDSVSALLPSQLFYSESNIPWHDDIPVLENGILPLSNDLLVYESYLQAKHIHNDALNVKHNEILALLIAKDIDDKERMSLWVQLFSERHELDLNEARRKARLVKWRIMCDRLVQQAAAFQDLYRLEPKLGLKMRDVYDASLVAATILKTRPSRLRSYLGTIGKYIGR
jgi:glycosyltransferase involved in cell wall biosynthesis